MDGLIALAEARRALSYPDPRASADQLDRSRRALAPLQARQDKEPNAMGTSTILAFRYARLLDPVR
ncbi:MAG: hypothetical protein K0M70_15630, partial [Arenimonas sp.]|uniref:hypothetical protein n=1 Tax=Arenimonas sp. TaxID=1872635 RepID=UPI0025BC92B9